MDNEQDKGGAPADFQAQFESAVKDKLASMTPEQKAAWWDCFVECLARENPAVKDCAKDCAITCAIEGPTPECLACILACGVVAWDVIIACAMKCS